MALRTRLIVAVSIVIALVLGVESLVEIRLFEETAERMVADYRHAVLDLPQTERVSEMEMIL